MENRLDIWLVEHLGIKSRSKAQELIRGGFVLCNGSTVTKTGFKVAEKDEIKLIENNVLKYVSRGGLKLEKAIDEFKLDFKDKIILDIGSSTGGFTDCALKAGAKKVIAVDVGTDIMDENLRKDVRVELHENTDIRSFPEEMYQDIDYAVCDASFISLPVALKGLKLRAKELQLIALIKPQFECGIQMAKKYKGVLTDIKLHQEILKDVLSSMEAIGFGLQNITWSPICGGDGNIEYIAHFVRRCSEAGDESLYTDSGITVPNIAKLTENAFNSLKN